MEARAECDLARGEPAAAATLAGNLVQLATRHHEPSYLARGHRLLAQAAVRSGDPETAARHISSAIAALDHCEAWTVEWRVHALAVQVFSSRGQLEQAENSRQHSLRATQRVAATLVHEPALQGLFLERAAEILHAASCTSA